jgi:hypothetical protein
MVSIVDVLKQEKLFGSADMILNKLHSEGWIADASKRDHVYVTTWGLEEVRRSAGAPPPDASSKAPEPKNAEALRAAAGKARELADALEEFATGAGGTGAQRKAKAKKALAATAAAVEEAFG